MKKIVKLNESDLVNIVKKVIKEEERPRGGMTFSDSLDSDLIQAVIDRMTKFHTKGKIKKDEEAMEKYKEYIKALKALNREFPL